MAEKKKSIKGVVIISFVIIVALAIFIRPIGDFSQKLNGADGENIGFFEKIGNEIGNIIPIGKATGYTNKIQIYGNIYPQSLPDGTTISFKLDNGLEIGSGDITDNKYGYDDIVFLEKDDSSTAKIKGYAEGYKINVYIEDIKIGEISYIESDKFERDFEIPASKRTEVSNRLAEIALCTSEWECGEWSRCIDNQQTRECVDKNRCKYEKDKPDETKKCLIRPEYEQPIDEEEYPVFTRIKEFIGLSRDIYSAKRFFGIIIIPIGLTIILVALIAYRIRNAPKLKEKKNNKKKKVRRMAKVTNKTNSKNKKISTISNSKKIRRK